MRYFSTKELHEFAQQTVDAMCAVLDLQVTIVDEKARRVAGTGCFSNNIDENLPTGYVFQRVINTGGIFFIENPGQTTYCEECLERDICKEKATLLVPVKLDRQVIGGIGLAAMTDEEKVKLVNNIESYTRFMEKMAELLSAKVKSDLESNENLILAKNLNTIIESYPYGIISMDSLGVVTHFNRNAELILNIASKNIINKQYTDKISCEFLEKALSNAESYQSIKTKFSINNNTEVELILSIQPILQNNKIEKIVCFFQEYKENNKINKMIQDSVKYASNNIQGQSLELRKVLDLIRKIASSNTTVLITGESGTGKELFAKAIHYESNRSNEPFIAINCSAIPDNLLESELFGYSKGAFTSANTTGKMGKFELANKGTIFLDEIGDMPINLQAKLLRVLQEKKIEKLGDTKSIDVDIRILAATNKDLKELIEQKLFREDLYYRINVIPLHLPPLKCRKGDVPILAKYFLEKHDLLLLKNIKGFLPETITILNNYDWPGNIRELENVIEYAINMENSEFIQPDSLPLDIINCGKRDNGKIEINKMGENLQNTIDEVEKIKLKELLSIYGNTTESKKIIAKKLNISLSTLYRKLKKLEY